MMGSRFFVASFEVLFYGDGDDLFLAAGFDGDFCGSAFSGGDYAVCGDCRYVFVGGCVGYFFL